MSELPDVRGLAGADESRVLKLWEGLGYYSRARNLQAAAKIVMTEHNAVVPRTIGELQRLPGIGRYTAGAICSIAFNQPTPVLDGNVTRVLTRLFGITADAKTSRTNTRLWQLAGELVQHGKILDPECGCSFVNQSLMELGAVICTPGAPNCRHCPVRGRCNARLTARVDRIPNLPRRAKPTERKFVAFVVRKNDRYLVQRRPNGVVNQGLWEFPNVEIANGEANNLKKLARATLRFPVSAPELLCTIRHSITRYRIGLDAFHCVPVRASNSGTWLTLAEVDACSLTSAHRKILQRIHSPA